MNDFYSAIENYQRACDRYGDESVEAMRWYRRVINLAPDDIYTELLGIAHKLNLVPKASAYTDDGKPLYELNDVSRKMNVPIAILRESLYEIEQDTSKPIFFTGTVNRVQ